MDSDNNTVDEKNLVQQGLYYFIYLFLPMGDFERNKMLPCTEWVYLSVPSSNTISHHVIETMWTFLSRIENIYH